MRGRWPALQRHAQRDGERFEHPLDRVQVRAGRFGRPPGGRRGAPAQENPERAVLLDPGLPQGVARGLARILVHRGGPAEDRAHLEDPQIELLPRGVACGAVEQRAEQRGAQQRVLLRQRVLQGHSIRQARVVLAQAQAAEGLARGEGPPHRLIQPAPHQRVHRAAAQALLVREQARGTVAGQRGGKLLQAVDAGDLLDQVRLARYVRTPQGGHGDVEAVGRLPHLEIECLQDLHLACAGHGHAEDRLHARLAQPDHLRRGRLGPDVDRPGQERGAAQLDHQAGRERLRVVTLLGGEALLEARGGLAAQPERPGGAVDVGPIPVGDLHQHPRGALPHLRARSAHQARDRGGALAVLDHHHLPVQRAGLTVERLHLLARAGAAHHEPPPSDAVEVEGVQRLAGEEHRVVGYVNHVVDRALPRRAEARLRPRRRLGDGHVLEHPRGEARAEVGTAHLDLRGGRATARDWERPLAAEVLAPWRRGKRSAGGGVQLARDPVHPQAVWAVGSHLQLDHLRGDRQHLLERSARGELTVAQHLVQYEDALDPIPTGGWARINPELLLRADHPLRDHAAQLGALDLHPVRHHRAGARHRHRLPRRHVRGPAHDLRRPVRGGGSKIDLAHTQPIGVRVAFGGEHPPHHEPLRRPHAVVVDRLHLRTRHRQALLDPPHVQVGIAVLAQPLKGDPHPNCSRNLKSFSK